MKLRLSAITLFCLCQVMLPAQTWTTLDNAPIAGRWDDVYFINDSVGWACNSEGNIFKTTDRGDTWDLSLDNGPYLRSIEFLDEQTGFAGGLFSSTVLLKTVNGGDSWTNITNLIPASYSGICGLSNPRGTDVIYGCGKWSTPAYIIKSTDRGNTWTSKDMSQYASKLVDIFFISPDTGWVCGTAANVANGGILLRTVDGGQTWTTLITTGVTMDYIWKIQTPDSIHFFASIERGLITQGLRFLKSSDGGLTWEQKSTGLPAARVQCIGFLDSLHGWMGDEQLFYTKNGGDSWEELTPFDFSINRFWRFDNNHALVSGNRLHRYDQMPASGTHAPVTPQEAHGLRVAPNPSTGKISIDIDLRFPTSVLLSVISHDGKMIRDLWHGEYQPGPFHFDTHLPPGEYVVWFKTHYGTQTRQVVVK